MHESPNTSIPDLRWLKFLYSISTNSNFTIIIIIFKYKIKYYMDNSDLENYINAYRELYILEQAIENLIRSYQLPQDLQDTLELIQYMIDDTKQTVLDNLWILAFPASTEYN